MLKCKVCFFQKLPPFWVPDGPVTESRGGLGQSGHYIPMEERAELVHIALAQSFDAVMVKNGDALCEQHLLTLGDVR